MQIPTFWENAKNHKLNFSYYIAKRYLFSKSKSNAINIITIIAALGVFAGAFALFVVLSGFAGLKDFSLSFSNNFDPDLKVFPQKGKSFILSEEEKEQLSKIEGVATFTEVVEERIFLDFKQKNKTAKIKGVDQDYQQVNIMDSSLVRGSWLNKDQPQVVIGNTISMELSLGVHDYSSLLKIFVPKPGKGQISDPTGAFNTKTAIVTGIYSINEELDDQYVFSTLRFARDLLNFEENEVTAVEIKTAKGINPDDLKENIAEVLNTEVNIKNRAQLNDALYKMLNTENLAVYLIFTLVLIIALFNVIGSIIMVILDKKENIKTYYSLGASAMEIKNVFFFQGTFMSVLGGLIGLIAAIALVQLQLTYSFVMITPTLPYPVAITYQNILVVFLTISALGIGASYVASSRVGKILNR